MEKHNYIGLITAPELPTEMVKKIIDKLPQIFEQKIDRSASWEVEMVEDPLTGAAEGANEIFDETLKIKKKNNWDYAISLTDLPIFYGKYTVAADQHFQNNIASISIPAFGWIKLKSAVMKAIVHILKELVYHSEDKNREEIAEKCAPEKWEKNFPAIWVKRMETVDHPRQAEVQYLIIPKVYGKIRLLIGMIQSNRPMSIMRSFKKVLAVAFSTGAFGLIFTTLWNLSVILSTARLGGLMTAAIMVMIIWIIFNHHLWEGKSAGNDRRLRRLYNLATFFTIFISVVTYYILLWGFFFTAAAVLIPPEVFKDAVPMEGDTSIVHYMRVSWVAASISTIAGAIGAGMENEELVRDITYGYRQKRRFNGIQSGE